jgi:hypothetical protein
MEKSKIKTNGLCCEIINQPSYSALIELDNPRNKCLHREAGLKTHGEVAGYGRQMFTSDKRLFTAGKRKFTAKHHRITCDNDVLLFAHFPSKLTIKTLLARGTGNSIYKPFVGKFLPTVSENFRLLHTINISLSALLNDEEKGAKKRSGQSTP